MAQLGLKHQVLHGSGARMDILSDGEVDLVVTSPPYFSEVTEAKLSARRRDQYLLHEVENELYTFVGNLRPIFDEVHRVLRSGRAFVLQTKDIRYGECLIPLSDQHVAVARTCGFQLVTRFSWVPALSHLRRRPRFLSQRRVGQFRVTDGEIFIVMGKPTLDLRGGIVDVNVDLNKLALPVWRMPFRRRKDDHPHVSPRPVLQALIGLLSERGDLVVDPFAGYGTTIEVAKSLKRSAIGWDIEINCVAEANRRLQ
jgi:DNA modification methylase